MCVTCIPFHINTPRSQRDQRESIPQSISRLHCNAAASLRAQQHLDVNDTLAAPFISQRVARARCETFGICTYGVPTLLVLAVEKGRVTTDAVYDLVSLLAALGKARSGSLSPATMGQ